MEITADFLTELFRWMLLGDFGLLTATPKYLFLTLFPVMILLGLLGQVLERCLSPSKASRCSRFFLLFSGLGCTTAALAALQETAVPKGTASAAHMPAAGKGRLLWSLILLVPCSAQLTMIATFALMVPPGIFLRYLGFCFFFAALLYALIALIYPPTKAARLTAHTARTFRLLPVIGDAFGAVMDTLLPFCVGSIGISLAMYLGLLNRLTLMLGPWLENFLHLPPEATGLLFLNMLKRDFGSTALLSAAESGAFDGTQLVVVMVMLTFSVPCFNSMVLLFKQQRLPNACLIWLGSLFISILLGKAAGSLPVL